MPSIPKLPGGAQEVHVRDTSSGELRLTWTREAGLGGNGRGCQVAEVMLKPVVKKEA